MEFESIDISIGLSFYNAEKYLLHAINSILNQDYKNFELIITNDGSTDNSINIIKSFQDNRIIFLNYKNNLGLPTRLNEQIQLSRGRYFMRMDADDIMLPYRLRLQLNYLNNNNNIDILGASAIIIDSNNCILGFRKSKLPNNIFDCFYSISFIHPTVVAKTDWFRMHMYNTNYNGVEDRDLWLRTLNNSTFALIDEPLIFYRDSMNFNLINYKYRIKQLLLLLNNNRTRLKLYQYFCIKMIIYFKLLIFSLFNTSFLVRFIIKKRNRHFTTLSFHKYNDLLKHLL